MITFAKRPRIEVTRYDFRHRTWKSRCGRFKIVHSTCLLGPQQGPERLPPVYLAMRLELVSKTWQIISRHRQQGAAKKACEKAERTVSRGQTH